MPSVATASATTTSPNQHGITATPVPRGGAIQQTHEGKILQGRIRCDTHRKRIGCRINGETGEHTEVDEDEFGLWTLMIVCLPQLSCVTFHLICAHYQANGEATYTNGPLNPPIEPIRKRRRVSPPHHTPEIHVHVSNPLQTANAPPPAVQLPPPAAQPPVTQLPPPTSAPNPPSTTPTYAPVPAVDVIDLTDLPSSDEEGDDDIVYPLIQDLLAELDQRYPGVQYVQYNQRMLEAGFSRVNQIRDCRRTRHILLHLSIPPTVVDQIVSRARRLQRRSEKQPADVQAIKKEED
jgi:hypothetical protein